VDRVDLDDAESAATAVLEEARVLADPTTLSYTCYLAAAVRDRRGDHQASRELLLESITLAGRVGDPHGIIRALGGLGWNEFLTGDYRRARQTLLDQLARVSPGDKPERLGIFNNIGWAELFLGEYADAHSHFDSGLLLVWELRNKRLVAEGAIGVAAIRSAEGETARVTLLWERAAACSQSPKRSPV
jgi:hypothetical protein